MSIPYIFLIWVMIGDGHPCRNVPTNMNKRMFEHAWPSNVGGITCLADCSASFSITRCTATKCCVTSCLVGGSNHLEKYESQWPMVRIILSHILWKIKHVPNHQPVVTILQTVLQNQVHSMLGRGMRLRNHQLIQLIQSIRFADGMIIQ